MFLKHDARLSSLCLPSWQWLVRHRRRSLIAGALLLPASIAGVARLSSSSAQTVNSNVLIASAQQTPSNQERYTRGTNFLRNGQYEEALADLQQVDAAQLNERDRRDLTTNLTQASQAADQRKAARAAFEQGEQSLAANRLPEASTHYRAAMNNRFADEGTRAKSREQLAVVDAMMRQSGQSLRDIYNQAIVDYRDGNLGVAKPKFEQLVAADFRPGFLQRNPSDYLAEINQKLAAAQPAPAAPQPVPVVQQQQPTPAPAAQPVAPEPVVMDAKTAYRTGVAQYRKGDWISARQNLELARSQGYRAGLFEDPPEKILARMTAKEQADAQQNAAEVAAAQRLVAVRAAQEEAARQAALQPRPEPIQPAPVLAQPEPAPQPPPPVVVQQQPPVVIQPAPAEQPAPVVVQPVQPAPIAVQPVQARVEAQRLVEQAETARANNRLDEALALYLRAVELDPTNTAAVAGRDAVSRILSRPAGGPDILAQQEIAVQQQRDSINYTFQTAMDEAQRRTREGDFNAAGAAIQRARVARLINPGVFRDEELRAFDTRIAQAERSLADSIENKRLSDTQMAADQARVQIIEQESIRLRERNDTIRALKVEARRLIEEGNYKQAKGVLDQILKLDPKDDYATGVIQIVEDRVLISDQRRYRERLDRESSRQFIEAEEQKIPYSDILKFPDNWPDLSAMRDRSVAQERGERPEDQAVLAQLDRPLPGEVRLDNINLSEVVDFLRDVTGANIYVNWRALETAGIGRDAPVSTGRLRNIKFSKALQTILDDIGGGTVRLGYTIDEGVISISTEEDLARNVITRVYDIRDLIVNVEDFDQPPQFQISAPTQGRGGGGGQNLFGGGIQQQAGANTRDALVASITTLIRDIVATATWRENGGNIGSIRELAGQLIVTQTPENQRELQRLLEQLRETRAIQITVETRFITVQRNFLEEVGVDFDLFFPAGEIFSNVGPVGVQNNTAAFTSIENLSTGVPGAITDALRAGSSAATIPPNFGLNNGTGGAITFLDDFQVSLLIRATQISQNTTNLTAPRLTLFNGQRAFVVVASESAYVSDLTPIVGTNAVAFDPTVSVIQSGVLLDVQATVSADRKYVTLTLRPTLARLRSLISFPVSALANVVGPTGGATQTITQAFIQQPVRDITSVNTTVSVPDGGTLLLGGQTLAGEIERESGVPVLSKIPFLKRLFTNTGMAKDEQVLLILVKPTIVIQKEREQEQFPLLGTR